MGSTSSVGSLTPLLSSVNKLVWSGEKNSMRMQPRSRPMLHSPPSNHDLPLRLTWQHCFLPTSKSSDRSLKKRAWLLMESRLYLLSPTSLRTLLVLLSYAPIRSDLDEGIRKELST